MDSTDLRVEAILGEAFAEVYAPRLADPDDLCRCGHVRDLHDGADVLASRRGCSACGCEEFEAAR